MNSDRDEFPTASLVRLSVSLLFLCSTTSRLFAQQAAPSGGDGVVLVAEGQPKAVIVWDAKAVDDPFYDEVQPYIEEHLPWAIEQITGTKLKVVTEAPGGDVPAIMIGKSWLPADARKRLEQAGQRFDSRILTRVGHRIYLAGASVRGDAGAISENRRPPETLFESRRRSTCPKATGKGTGAGEDGLLAGATDGAPFRDETIWPASGLEFVAAFSASEERSIHRATKIMKTSRTRLHHQNRTRRAAVFSEDEGWLFTSDSLQCPATRFEVLFASQFC